MNPCLDKGFIFIQQTLPRLQSASSVALQQTLKTLDVALTDVRKQGKGYPRECQKECANLELPTAEARWLEIRKPFIFFHA